MVTPAEVLPREPYPFTSYGVIMASIVKEPLWPQIPCLKSTLVEVLEFLSEYFICKYPSHITGKTNDFVSPINTPGIFVPHIDVLIKSETSVED